MPATVEQRDGKWRVVEAESKRLVKRAGSPVDGGGHGSKEKAKSQARAINQSQNS